jgi:hypothetical protein
MIFVNGANLLNFTIPAATATFIPDQFQATPVLYVTNFYTVEFRSVFFSLWADVLFACSAFCYMYNAMDKNKNLKSHVSDILRMIYMFPLHRIELYKRMPLVSFATAWNSIVDYMYNPRQKAF